mmetsp:Transcript_84256/g.195888  ORF Transcript_84256/g.195888 Transcript_84256/m.195888 type:complete len:247 (-) Transcript_84256:586-1326(-)
MAVSEGICWVGHQIIRVVSDIPQPAELVRPLVSASAISVNIRRANSMQVVVVDIQEQLDLPLLPEEYSPGGGLVRKESQFVVRPSLKDHVGTVLGRGRHSRVVLPRIYLWHQKEHGQDNQNHSLRRALGQLPAHARLHLILGNISQVAWLGLRRILASPPWHKEDEALHDAAQANQPDNPQESSNSGANATCAAGSRVLRLLEPLRSGSRQVVQGNCWVCHNRLCDLCVVEDQRGRGEDVAEEPES